MLEFLRRNAQSVFFQAIVVIIIFAFVFWGGSSMMNSRESAIQVNKEEVSFQEVDKAYNQAYARLSDQFGGQIPKGLAETLGVKKQVINQLVQDSLLRQGAKKMGVVVSANEIQEEIQSMVQFQQDGGFNMERYKSILASNRLSPAKFEKSMKRDLLAQKTISDIGKFVSEPTEFEINNLYTLENETVSVEFIKASPADYIEDVKPTDEQLASWFDINKDNYKSEPQLKLRYLSFTYDEVGGKITIDDTDIEQYYQTNIANYQTPESRHARHILLKADSSDSEATHSEKLTKAQEVLKLVKAGDDFAELAQKYSEGPSGPTGGDLGFFSKGQMVPEFDQAVFLLKTGESSNVVKTAFGYHIIKIEEIKPSVTTSLEEVKDSIGDTLSLKQAKPLAFQLANQAYEGIIGAGSLDNYAKENSETQITETDFFTKSAPPENLKADPQFVEKAFALNKGELSSLIETDAGYAIIFASDIQEPVVPSIDSVKENVTADYVTEQSAVLAQEATQKLITSISGEKDFQSVVSEAGFTLQSSGLFTKAKPNEESSFPAALIAQAFRLTTVEPTPSEPAMVGNDYYVFHLTERKAPEGEMTDEEKAGYKDTLKRLKQQQILSAWIKNQEQDTVVTIHQSLND